MTDRQLTVLVVDDHRQVLLVTQMLLQKLGFRVLISTNAQDGVFQAVTHRPDLILSDIMMPQIDGFQYLQLLKKRDETKDIPVIMVTAKNSRKDILLARQLGAANYVVKPITLEVLKQKIGAEFDRLGIECPWTKMPAPPVKPAAAPAATPAAPQAAATASTQAAAPNAKAPAPKAPAAENKTAQPAGEKAAPAPAPAPSVPQGPMSILGLDPRIGLRKLIKRTQDLPALPVAVQRAIAVSTDENSGAADLAKIIASDSAIAAMVLRTANSAYYGSQQRIGDIKQAIIRIGFTTTRNLVVCFSVTGYFSSESQNPEFNRMEFWMHSLSTAIIAGRLSRRAGVAEFSETFIAGLVHDIGKIIMDEHIPTDYAKALSTARGSQRPLYQVEFELFKFDHMDLGMSLAERWQMPSMILKCVANHDRSSEIDNEPDPICKRILQLVSMANQISKAMGLGDGGDRLLGGISDDLAAWTRLENGLPKTFKEEVYKELNEYRTFLGAEPLEQQRQTQTTLHYCHPGRPVLDGVAIFLESLGYELIQHPTTADVLKTAKNKAPTPFYLVTLTREPTEEDIASLRDTAMLDKHVILLLPSRFQGPLLEKIEDERLIVLPWPPDREALRLQIDGLSQPAKP